ncbi:hypothetical protein [Oceanithermus sp.]|uniref:hypothetical protein n=1 Tax=Oceanithermus sp. TaxID=2268145 RepID=UPI0025E65BF1|nr:hypothetical protein [Oceanithermus sp.]
MAKPKKHGYGNVFVGFMFLGMGLGWLFGHLAAGLFIGMGLGFIAQDLLEGKERAASPESEPAAAPARSGPDLETVWGRIEAHQGEPFRLAMGQAFTYTVEGSAVVPSTTNVRIQKSQFAKALPHVPFQKVSDVPKDVFGPSYVYAILMDERIRDGDW